MAEKPDKSDTEMDTCKESGGEFVKDHKEIYSKINAHVKYKARKECLWERFANSCKLSVKVCKTCPRTRNPHLNRPEKRWRKGRTGFRIN